MLRFDLQVGFDDPVMAVHPAALKQKCVRPDAPALPFVQMPLRAANRLVYQCHAAGQADASGPGVTPINSRLDRSVTMIGAAGDDRSGMGHGLSAGCQMSQNFNFHRAARNVVCPEHSPILCAQKSSSLTMTPSYRSLIGEVLH